MRVMLTALPQICHLYPIIPYAQALQAAGHEVVIAAPPGAADDIIAAGLTAVSCGEAVPPSLQNWAKHGLLPDAEERERLASLLAIRPEDRDHWDVFYQFYVFACRFYLPREPRQDIDSLVEFARAWKPDLVLWESWFPVGGVVARACGAAHARILIGPDYGAWSIDQYAAHKETAGAELGENPLLSAVRPVAEQYGVEVDDDLLLGALTIDPLPAEMRLSRSVDSLPVRWVPYNGGGELPSWLYTKPERPRVALTLGVSNRAYNKGDSRVAALMEAVGGLDIEVVATLDAAQLDGAPPLPDNVRVVDYVPLGQLLPTCDAVIHHGSSGTFWAAHAANLPQLIMDTDEPQRVSFTGEGESLGFTVSGRHLDSWLSSNYIVARGAGARLDHQKQSVAEIREQLVKVLTEPACKEAAAVLHREWLSRPGPADIVADLEKLAATHRPAT
ncbi:nucleotide disphospho-sugar-binding domain-containing protein [Streptomyces sp. NPDC051567]|uniref:nucleotide disphospho-sugar-binding domain-containing protein n=1 Tax=Streptomyces sp. NPDC051567 TaxID=3365660 RepID=UPI00379B083A